MIMGPHQGPSFGEVIVGNYEESIFHFTEMTQGIFGHLFKDEDPITLEKVIDQTNQVQGGPTVVGTPRLCVFWYACEDACDYMNAN